MCRKGDFEGVQKYHLAHQSDSLERGLLRNFGLNVFGHIRDFSWPVNCMMVAAAFGHRQLVTYLNSQGMDPDAANMLGITPLHLAADTGELEVVATLLDFGVNVNAQSLSGRTALHQAIAKGRQQVASILLDHESTDIFLADNDARTALHMAVELGQSAVVSKLLERGAHLNIGDIRRQTPLHMAAINNRLEVAEQLLKKGANIDARDKDGVTPLLFAAYKGHADMVELLLSNNANISLESARLGSALELASKDGYVDVIDVLGRHNRKSPPQPSGEALHNAAMKGHLGAVEALLNQNADVNAFRRDGFQPLHLAAQEGHLGVVKALVKSGAEIDGGKEPSPLLLAVRLGRVDVVNYLLESGARPEPGDNSRQTRTPLEEAITTNYDPADETPGVAVRLVTALLEKGARVNRVGKNGYTPLNLVAKYGRSDLVKTLLEHGADATKTGCSRNGTLLTPLQHAVVRGHGSTAGVLLADQLRSKTSLRGVAGLVTSLGAMSVSDDCLGDRRLRAATIAAMERESIDGDTATTIVSNFIPMMPVAWQPKSPFPATMLTTKNL